MTTKKLQKHFPDLNLTELQLKAKEWATTYPNINKICLFRGYSEDDLHYVILVYIPPFSRKMLARDLPVGMKVRMVIDKKYYKYEVVENELFGVGVIVQDGQKLKLEPRKRLRSGMKNQT